MPFTGKHDFVEGGDEAAPKKTKDKDEKDNKKDKKDKDTPDPAEES